MPIRTQYAATLAIHKSHTAGFLTTYFSRISPLPIVAALTSLVAAGSSNISSAVFQPSSLGSSLPQKIPHIPIGIATIAGTINIPATDPPKKVFAPQTARIPAIIAPRLCEAFHQPIKRPRNRLGVHRFIVELQEGPPGAWNNPLIAQRRIKKPYGWCALISTIPMITETTPAIVTKVAKAFLVFRPSK